MNNFLQKAFNELNQEDGLSIFGHGLGIEILCSKFLEMYSAAIPRQLVFCINATNCEQNIKEWMLTAGIPPTIIPKVSIYTTTVFEFAIKHKTCIDHKQ
jgi:hypothetical protein